MSDYNGGACAAAVADGACALTSTVPGSLVITAVGNVRLAIDVFTDDSQEGQFRIHLTSRTRRLFLFERVTDTDELEDLRSLVESELRAWDGRGIKVEHLDRNYM